MNWICLAQVRLKMMGCCENGNEAAIKGKEFYGNYTNGTSAW